jgi:transposase-like protein
MKISHYANIRLINEAYFYLNDEERCNLEHICPRCGSDAIYSYGHTRNGKQRYLCLMCNRQFVEGAMEDYSNRPVCPRCDKAMHLYMHERGAIRFRCANYPRCREYLKISKEKLEE